MCVHPQERRREFEANLEKVGLELETDDKAVRNSTTEYLHHLVDGLQRHTMLYRKKVLKGWLSIRLFILPSIQYFKEIV